MHLQWTLHFLFPPANQECCSLSLMKGKYPGTISHQGVIIAATLPQKYTAHILLPSFISDGESLKVNG